MSKSVNIKAPKHLAAATRRWFEEVCSAFVLESHHLRLLALAGETWDRVQEARAALEEHGLTFEDRFGQPRARPEVAVARDGSILFARLVRELGLDDTPENPKHQGGKHHADPTSR